MQIFSGIKAWDDLLFPAARANSPTEVGGTAIPGKVARNIDRRVAIVRARVLAAHADAIFLDIEMTKKSKTAPSNLCAVVRESTLLPATAAAQQQSVFGIPKMDCPSEENLIRMALRGMPDITSLSFDLAKRQVTALHQGSAEIILQRLQPLNLGATLLESTQFASQATTTSNDAATDGEEAFTLWWLLAMNAAMFVIEIIVGLYAESTGLIADSLDMFADAAVYGLALYAVGRAEQSKQRAAHWAGWLQILLGLMALTEVGRSFIFGSEPQSALMISISLLALVVNVASLVMIARKRHYGIHMKASYIFSANDVIANLGVIVAGVLVAWTGSSYPDLIIGTLVTVIVLNGARRILQLR